MRKKRVKVEKHNTKIAIVFFIFVIAIVLTSLIIKAIAVVRLSIFDGNHRFTISVSNDKNLEVVSFSPNNHSISILRIEEENKDPKTVGQFLKIPIDGFVKASFLKTHKDVAILMPNIFFNYNNIKTNLNLIDILRLVLVSKTTPLNNIATYSISSSLEDQKVDKIVEKIFKDEEIEKENKSVEIINTTNVMGLGGRLARLITNMGGNVIQVSTKDNLQKESIILYDGKKNFTTERLSKVLGFRTSETSKQSIADITIVIGFDNRDPLSF